MKRKIISLCLIAIIVFCSTNSIFAMEIAYNNTSNIPNTSLALINDNEDEIPTIQKGNMRYRYTTKVTYSNKKTKTFTVTNKQSKTESSYTTAIFSAITTFLPGGNWAKLSGLIFSIFAGEYYTSPYSAAGKYIVTTYTAKEIKTNVLTKKSHISRQGIKIIIQHKSKKVERLLWLK